jgi:shikimate 5-dehydrogenase
VRRLLAVLGRDVSRSRSPELHARAAAVLGLDVAYVPVCCADEAHFDRAVLALGTLGARGANVTIPYKARALAQATVVSARAELLGAANVLSFEPDGAVLADNTDGPALVDVLGAYDPRSLERVVVLGAGGAARAVVWALGQVGAREVVVCARDMPGRLGELLVRENLISLQQLQQAQEEQRKTGGRLGYNLTKLGYIEENELTEFLSKQYGVPRSTSPSSRSTPTSSSSYRRRSPRSTRSSR